MHMNSMAANSQPCTDNINLGWDANNIIIINAKLLHFNCYQAIKWALSVAISTIDVDH